MARDIRNVERGACIDGCLSCPSFVSVEPGRILCDYCGCPPTKHEIVQSDALMTFQERDEICTSEENQGKGLNGMKQMKNVGLCFSASRTSSNDSGCYISCSSFESSSTSASTSSCSPYISEEEIEKTEDDCVLSSNGDAKLNDEFSSNFTACESKNDNLQSKSGRNCSVEVYKCASTEMIVKIRTKPEQKMMHDEKNYTSHAPAVIQKDRENSTIKYGSDISDNEYRTKIEQLQPLSHINLNSSFKTCKRNVKEGPFVKLEAISRENHEESCPLSSSKGEEAVIKESCTLYGMGQLEIGDECTIHSDIDRRKENNGDNKITRTEGDCDVFDHIRKTMAGTDHNRKRSERVKLRYPKQANW